MSWERASPEAHHEARAALECRAPSHEWRVWLEELTRPEAKAACSMPDAVVVIPIGAASKAHWRTSAAQDRCADGAGARAEADRAAAGRRRRPWWASATTRRSPVSPPAASTLTADTFKADAARADCELHCARRAAHRAGQHRRVDREADRRNRQRDRRAGAAHAAQRPRGGRVDRAQGRRSRRRARDLGRAGARSAQRAHERAEACRRFQALRCDRRSDPRVSLQGRAPAGRARRRHGKGAAAPRPDLR